MLLFLKPEPQKRPIKGGLVMKNDRFIRTAFSTLFENPDLAKLVISDLKEIKLKELHLQPTVIVPGDDCADSRENGIFYVAFDVNGIVHTNSFVAQGLLARSFIDFFGRNRVRKAIISIKKHFETHGVTVYEEKSCCIL